MYTNEEIRKCVEEHEAREALTIREIHMAFEAKRAEWVKLKVEEYLQKHGIQVSKEQKQEIIAECTEHIKQVDQERKNNHVISNP